MTTEQTYKETARAKTTVTLVVNPGTDKQRALRTCQQDRLDHRAVAEYHARLKYGSEANLAWITNR